MKGVRAAGSTDGWLQIDVTMSQTDSSGHSNLLRAAVISPGVCSLACFSLGLFLGCCSGNISGKHCRAALRSHTRASKRCG